MINSPGGEQGPRWPLPYCALRCCPALHGHETTSLVFACFAICLLCLLRGISSLYIKSLAINYMVIFNLFTHYSAFSTQVPILSKIYLIRDLFFFYVSAEPEVDMKRLMPSRDPRDGEFVMAASSSMLGGGEVPEEWSKMLMNSPFFKVSFSIFCLSCSQFLVVFMAIIYIIQVKKMSSHAHFTIVGVASNGRKTEGWYEEERRKRRR